MTILSRTRLPMMIGKLSQSILGSEGRFTAFASPPIDQLLRREQHARAAELPSSHKSQEEILDEQSHKRAYEFRGGASVKQAKPALRTSTDQLSPENNLVVRSARGSVRLSDAGLAQLKAAFPRLSAEQKQCSATTNDIIKQASTQIERLIFQSTSQFNKQVRHHFAIEQTFLAHSQVVNAKLMTLRENLTRKLVDHFANQTNIAVTLPFHGHCFDSLQAALAAQPRLESLNLNCQSTIASSSIADLIRNTAAQAPSLKGIRLGVMSIDKKLVDVLIGLTKTHRIESLIFDQCSMPLAEQEKLLSALAGNQTLRRLSLYRCMPRPLGFASKQPDSEHGWSNQDDGRRGWECRPRFLPIELLSPQFAEIYIQLLKTIGPQFESLDLTCAPLLGRHIYKVAQTFIDVSQQRKMQLNLSNRRLRPDPNLPKKDALEANTSEKCNPNKPESQVVNSKLETLVKAYPNSALIGGTYGSWVPNVLILASTAGTPPVNKSAS